MSAMFKKPCRGKNHRNRQINVSGCSQTVVIPVASNLKQKYISLYICHIMCWHDVITKERKLLIPIHTFF